MLKRLSHERKKRINGADVAREAGVSQSAVSLVLSGKPNTRISAETRRRILEAVERLGYRRNSAARALVTGKSGRIGIVPSHPNAFTNRDYYYGDLLAGMMSGIVDKNYNVLLHAANYPDWKALYEDTTNGNVDGVVVIGRSPADPLSLALCASSLPVVFVSSFPDTVSCHAVDCDNETGGFLAAQHLIELGHRHLAAIFSENGMTFTQERQRGIRRAIQEAGLPLETAFFLQTPGLEETQQLEWTQKLLDCLQKQEVCPTALITDDEWHAVCLARTLPKLGRRVPEDFSLVSYNSTESSALAAPALTSVRQPLPEIGAEAVKILLRLIAGEDAVSQVQRMPVTLEVRHSTRRLG